MAEAPAPHPVAPSLQELESALANIENPQARERLAGQLRAMIAAHRAVEAETSPIPPAMGTQLLSALANGVEGINRAVTETLVSLQGVPAFVRWSSDQFRDPATRASWAAVLWKIAAIVVAGFAAWWGVGGLIRRPRQVLATKRPKSLAGRIGCSVGIAVLNLLPVAAFAVGAYFLLMLIEAGPRTRLISIAVVNAVVVFGAAMANVHAAFAPQTPTIRIVPVSDETAHYTYIWIRRLGLLAIGGYFAFQASVLLGMPVAGAWLLLKTTGLVIATLLVILILQNREAVAGWVRGRGQDLPGLGAVRRRLADLWHLLAVFYVTAIFLVWASEVPGGFEYVMRGTALTVVVAGIAGLAAWGTRRLLRRGFAVREDLKVRFPGLEQRVNRYLPILDVVLRGAIILIAALFLMESWNINVFDWLDTPFGRRAAGSVFSIAVVLMAALIVWEIVNAAVERYLSGYDTYGHQVERSQRARTLIPLARKVLLFVLVVVVALVGLSELGVNIGPLLAGAGVVGLAVGFGSQKLVQDVITGAFILIEDAISVGDVVQVGDHSGVVEGISIRSMRLRDLNGNVHTIPFSSVSTVINMTKDFSHYLLDVGVAYREDTDAVATVLKDIDEGMRNDPQFGPLMLEPIEILGVDRFEDSAVIIRARLKTHPVQQWTVGREFNRRMKKRFDELGIEIPFPHRTVYFGIDKKGDAPAASRRDRRRD